MLLGLGVTGACYCGFKALNRCIAGSAPTRNQRFHDEADEPSTPGPTRTANSMTELDSAADGGERGGPPAPAPEPTRKGTRGKKNAPARGPMLGHDDGDDEDEI